MWSLTSHALIKTKNDKFDTLFKTKIMKNLPWLAVRPHYGPCVLQVVYIHSF